MQSSQSILGPLCALGSSITWALAATVYTQTAGRIGPLRTNLWRATIVFPLFVLCATAIYGAQSIISVPPTQIAWLSMSTLCSYALGDLLFYMAALRLGTATALAIASIYPVWAVLGGALFLGEPVGLARLGGTLCCIGGVMWLVLQQKSAPPPQANATARPWLGGLVLSIVASFLWAGNTFAIRRGGVALPFLVVNSLRYFMAVVVLAVSLGVQLIRESRQAKVRRPDRSLPLRYFGMVLLEAFGGSSIFVYGLSHSDLSIAAPLTSLAPLFSVPIGLAMGTESLNLRRLLAIIITVGGVILLVR